MAKKKAISPIGNKKSSDIKAEIALNKKRKMASAVKLKANKAASKKAAPKPEAIKSAAIENAKHDWFSFHNNQISYDKWQHNWQQSVNKNMAENMKMMHKCLSSKNINDLMDSVRSWNSINLQFMIDNSATLAASMMEQWSNLLGHNR
jgi:hypothetical protein